MVEMTICSALKYSLGARGSVELNGILSLGGLQGAAVTIHMMSSNPATSVTGFLANTDTLKIPNVLKKKITLSPQSFDIVSLVSVINFHRVGHFCRFWIIFDIRLPLITVSFITNCLQNIMICQVKI